MSEFHSFLWLSNILSHIYVCVCLYIHTHTHTYTCTYTHTYTHYIFFIHSSVHGHLGSFHILAIVHSAAVNIGVMYLFKFEFSSFPDICPGVRLLDHMVVLFLVFWGTSILFSIVTAPIYIPTNSVPRSLFSTFSPTFAICRLLDDSHFDRCEVI